MTTTHPIHLQLISSTDKLGKSDSRSKSEPRQLELPLPDVNSAILVDAQSTSQHAFQRLLQESLQSILFDARVVPRLDILAGSRKQAFQWFEANGSCYVDLFGRLDVSSRQSVSNNPAIWIDPCIEYLKKEGNVYGPYVFIFDNSANCATAEDIITRALEGYTQKKIKLIRWP